MLKGAEFGSLPADPGNVRCDAAVSMAEHLLSSLEIHSFLPQHGCQAMSEAVPADSLLDANPIERRPNMTFENHIRR